MKIEDKIILARDLCYRLPYGVYVEDTRCGIRGSLHDLFIYPKYKGNDIDDYIACTGFYHDCYYDDITLFKPYLFPMSSMTKEQKEKFIEISGCETQLNEHYGFNSCGNYVVTIGDYEYDYDEDINIDYFYPNFETFDWLNKNHFDYRGLIEKGLAIDATNKNIYNDSTN
jgi:hypothetical protein